MPPQAPGIGVADVVHPAFDAGIEFAEADPPGEVRVEPLAEVRRRRPPLRAFTRRWVGWTTKPSHGMPQRVGSTCAGASWIVRRNRASRSTIARFHAHSSRLLSLNSAKSST